MMFRWLSSISSTLASGLLAAAPMPTATSPAMLAELHARPSVVSELDALVPGRTQLIGVRFAIRDGWHLYWDGQNLAGYPPNLVWHAPEGVTVHPPVFPAPERYKQPELNGVEHTYHDQLLLLVPVTVDASVEPGKTIELTAEADWLVCEKSCIQEDAVIAFTLPVAQPDAEPNPTKFAPSFAAAREQIPREYDPRIDADLRFAFEGEAFTVTAKGAARLEFYPHISSAEFNDLYDAAESEDGSLTLDIDSRRPGEAHAVRGILMTQTKDGRTRYLWIDRPIPETDQPDEPAVSQTPRLAPPPSGEPGSRSPSPS